MKIAVMGAGAVGCYFGGMLARAGHDVTLVARPVHVEAIQRDGLLLDTLAFREHVPVVVGTEPGAAAGADLVLFCVKSIATETAAASIAPHLGAHTIVLSLQNGVDNAARLQALLPQRVLPAVVYVACEMVGAGHVRHRGRGELVLPDGPAGQGLAEVFRPAGIPLQLSDDVIGAQWAKLIVNCAYNALSAITQLPFGPLLQGEGIDAVMRDLVDECLAVAAADGIWVPGDPWIALQRTGSQAGQYSSMAQDLARGRLTEIDHLNGYVMRRGAALGVPTPVNRTLHAPVKLMQRRAQGGVAQDGGG